MIQEFVKQWEANKHLLESRLHEAHPSDYGELFKWLVEILYCENEYGTRPDPTRVHQIDDGDYQGTLVFVVAATGCQPSVYWYVKVDYGSCSGCDTFGAIRSYGDDAPSDAQVSDYMTLALHMLQELKPML